ncbi:MAG TPA: hypothetical protein VE842_13215 [Pyrinomonadaceae bacterium]|jgi:hypothetical protein|nr:hypothetical protein [Pyrinomonadaceae bacterium]
MSRAKCSCESLERLEGASVPAYIKAFLEQAGRDRDEKKLYRCRVCGREWEKRSPQSKSEGARPSLVRLGDK